MKVMLLIAVMMLGAMPALAAGKSSAHPAAGHHEAAPGPVISTDAAWVGQVLIIVIGLFVAAAVIGPIYRLSLPEELPMQSHDEPPGSSGHHGASGTVDHSAPEKHGH